MTNRERAIAYLLPGCPPHPHELKRLKEDIDALEKAFAAARREAIDEAANTAASMLGPFGGLHPIPHAILKLADEPSPGAAFLDALAKAAPSLCEPGVYEELMRDRAEDRGDETGDDDA